MAFSNSFEALPPGWAVYCAPNGQPYYVETSTRRTQWEFPFNSLSSKEEEYEMSDNRRRKEHNIPLDDIEFSFNNMGIDPFNPYASFLARVNYPDEFNDDLKHRQSRTKISPYECKNEKQLKSTILQTTENTDTTTSATTTGNIGKSRTFRPSTNSMPNSLVLHEQHSVMSESKPSFSCTPSSSSTNDQSLSSHQLQSNQKLPPVVSIASFLLPIVPAAAFSSSTLDTTQIRAFKLQPLSTTSINIINGVDVTSDLTLLHATLQPFISIADCYGTRHVHLKNNKVYFSSKGRDVCIATIHKSNRELLIISGTNMRGLQVQKKFMASFSTKKKKTEYSIVFSDDGNRAAKVLRKENHERVVVLERGVDAALIFLIIIVADRKLNSIDKHNCSLRKVGKFDMVKLLK